MRQFDYRDDRKDGTTPRFWDGRLLVEVDVLYKLWDETALYEAVYDNQLVVQVGAQLTRGRYGTGKKTGHCSESCRKN